MEGNLFEHVWKEIEEREALQVRVEIAFLLDAFEDKTFYDTKELMETLDRITNKALEQVKQHPNEAYEDTLAQALRNGAGPAHKMTAVDGAFPPLSLVIGEETSEGDTYITAPIKVATTRTEPWAQVCRADSPSYDDQPSEVSS